MDQQRTPFNDNNTNNNNDGNTNVTTVDTTTTTTPTTRATHTRLQINYCTVQTDIPIPQELRD